MIPIHAANLPGLAVVLQAQEAETRLRELARRFHTVPAGLVLDTAALWCEVERKAEQGLVGVA